MMINKTMLIQTLLIEIEQSLSVATRAANDAKDLATHEQSKPETQYDTVGLEASYLAHGQSQRVAELKLALMQWRALSNTSLKSDGPIELGCLIQLINEQDEPSWFLLGPSMGGVKLNQDGKLITVITESAPLGIKLMGKYRNDEIGLTLQGTKRFYEIVSIT